MEKMVKYLDQVKAEDELKAGTRNHIKNALDNIADGKNGLVTSTGGGRNFAMKKLMTAVVSVAACAMLFIGGLAFYNQPVEYISFDINPSIELGVNAFDRVVSAEGINADGQALLQQNRFRNMSVDECMQALVQEAARQGYVKEDGSTVIALTALADDSEDAVRLQDRTRDRVQQTLQERDMDAIVYTDCSNLQLREQAHEQGLSAGKYRLISLLQSLDPSISLDQYRNARVTDIIAKANQLMQQTLTTTAQSGELERTRAMIMNAAQQIQQNQFQNQNRQQNQTQVQPSGEQQQLRNQNQNQYQNGTQSGDQQQKQEQNQYKYQNQNQTQTVNQSSGEQQQNQVQNQYQNQVRDQSLNDDQEQYQSQNRAQQGGKE